MYRIGELAAQHGIKTDTLRFYEKNQLLAPSLRTQAGYRLYSEQDKTRLSFILRAKSVGFSLQEIAELLQLESHKEQVTCQEVKALAEQKLQLIEQKIRELGQFRDNLQALSAICCGGLRSAKSCAILETLSQGAPLPSKHHQPPSSLQENT